MRLMLLLRCLLRFDLLVLKSSGNRESETRLLPAIVGSSGSFGEKVAGHIKGYGSQRMSDNAQSALEFFVVDIARESGYWSDVHLCASF